MKNTTKNIIKREILATCATVATTTLVKFISDNIHDNFSSIVELMDGKTKYNYAMDYVLMKDQKLKSSASIYRDEYYLQEGKYYIKLDRTNYLVVYIYDKPMDNRITNSIILKFVGTKCKLYKKEYEDYALKRMTSGTLFGTNMTYCQKLSKKTFDDIVTPNKQEIIDYLDMFINSKEYYDRHHITYKGGIILHGPKGNGKTSIVQAIANYIGYCVLTTTPDTISKLYSIIQQKSIVIIEDIDCYIGDRDKIELNDDNRKVMSDIGTLLNVLDGVSSMQEILFIATTNHIDRLDSAITRSGRFDLKVEIPNLEEKYAVELINKLEAKPEDIIPKITLPASASDIQAEVLKQRKGYNNIEE